MITEIRAYLPYGVSPAVAGPAGAGLAPGVLLFDARALLQFLELVSPPGQARFPFYRLVLNVPAGRTVTSTLEVEDGWRAALLEPWEVDSDVHRPGLLLDVYLDEVREAKRVTPASIPLTRAVRVSFHQMLTCEKRVIVSVTNGGPEDAEVTVDALFPLFEPSYWRDTVQPLIDYALSRLRSVSAALGATP